MLDVVASVVVGNVLEEPLDFDVTVAIVVVVVVVVGVVVVVVNVFEDPLDDDVIIFVVVVVVVNVFEDPLDVTVVVVGVVAKVVVDDVDAKLGLIEDVSVASVVVGAVVRVVDFVGVQVV